MSLKTRIGDDLKEAMKSKDLPQRDALRILQAAFKQVEIDQRIELDDEGITKILLAEAKKRREAIEAYRGAGRDEQAASELFELGLIERYLPKQLDRDEIKAIAQAIISEVGASSLKDIAKVMPAIMSKVKGQADGKLVNDVIRELLS